MLQLSDKIVLKSRGFPRQCAHWLGMTWFFDSLKGTAQPFLFYTVFNNVTCRVVTVPSRSTA